MGMQATYRAISPAEFDRLREDPAAADDYFYGPASLADDGDALIRREQAEVASGRRFDLDKDWHALHFLLTGDSSLENPTAPPPLGNAVLGGTDTEFEASYGAVRALSVEEVSAVASALRSISVEQLRSRFDPAVFDRLEIYPNPRPGGWTNREIESLWERYAALVSFFERAAAEGAIALLSLD